ncbi:MAG: ABC transporter substrate-binding protein, partial [Vulcanimicrobiaceae bacterium]
MLAAAVAVCVVAGCVKESGEGSGGRHPWTQPHVLRIVNVSEPDSLNVEIGNQQIDVDLSMFWAGYLLNYDDHNRFVPELATEEPTLRNGGIRPGGKTIVYHLRRGVRWQDGAPFTADDVVFSYRAVMNPRNNVNSRTGYD